ncbi:hypothetical protein ABRZ72_20255 [Vibrio vulnificus]|uniref:hypothetical protein n=1 Tax=Vibrio vulnificus TaxID=672 RepID=UPI0032EC0EB0
MARKSNQQQETVQAGIVEGNEQVTVTDDKPVDHFSNIVLDGKAKKLSPKTTNHVFYEIVLHDEENELYIRMTGNEGGGLFSRENIRLTDLMNVLCAQDTKPFKSTVVKSLFKSGSANNSGFLMACCRGLGLIIQSEKSVFLHVLAPDYVTIREEILSLVGDETKPE